MLLAIPILIAAVFFLGWLLVVLSINALPLFCGVSTGLFFYHLTGSALVGVMAGVAVAVALSILGRLSFDLVRSPLLRVAILLAFAGPAAAAACRATLGLSAHLVSSGAVRETVAMMAAFLVGSAAWRRFTAVPDRRQRV